MDSIEELPPLSQRVPEVSLPELPRDLGLAWRPLTREDARQLADLIAIIEETDASPFRTSYEETVELFEGDWKNFETDTIVAVNAKGEFLAYGLLHIYPGDDTLTRVFLDGGVHPTARDVGIGQSLVDWLTARGQQMLREADTRLPARIAAYVQDNAPHNWTLFEKAGYEARRFYKTLRRDLSKPIEPISIGSHLKVVGYDLALDEAVRLAHNDAFRDHWGSQPRTPEAWVQGRSMFKPEWSFIVLDETAQTVEGHPMVAGYIHVGKYEHDWEVAGYSSGYIELLGVRRDYRGQKIALALITEVMRILHENGIEYAELDVDSENPSGAFGIYTNLGFEVTTGSRMFSLEF